MSTWGFHCIGTRTNHCWPCEQGWKIWRIFKPIWSIVVDQPTLAPTFFRDETERGDDSCFSNKFHLLVSLHKQIIYALWHQINTIQNPSTSTLVNILSITNKCVNTEMWIFEAILWFIWDSQTVKRLPAIGQSHQSRWTNRRCNLLEADFGRLDGSLWTKKVLWSLWQVCVIC